MKLEFGARSDTEPVEPTDINPYLAEAIPELFTHSVFSVRTVRPEKQRGAWRQDYEAMRDSMFFGDPPTFDDILERIALLDQTLNEIPTDA